MKIKLLFAATLVAFLFNGCSSNISMNGVTTNDVKYTFQKAVVKSSNKVLVKKSKLATLGYASAGGVAGAGLGSLLGKDTKSTVIGGVVGSMIGAGASLFQETEAYQVEILSFKQQPYTTFVEVDLPIGSVVEFVDRGNGEITNVNFIELANENNEEYERIVHNKNL